MEEYTVIHVLYEDDETTTATIVFMGSKEDCFKFKRKWKEEGKEGIVEVAVTEELAEAVIRKIQVH